VRLRTSHYSSFLCSLFPALSRPVPQNSIPCQAIAADEARMRAVRAGLDRGTAKLSAQAASLGGKLSAANAALKAAWRCAGCCAS
jgi:hypothetical protein